MNYLKIMNPLPCPGRPCTKHAVSGIISIRDNLWKKNEFSKDTFGFPVNNSNSQTGLWLINQDDDKDQVGRIQHTGVFDKLLN